MKHQTKGGVSNLENTILNLNIKLEATEKKLKANNESMETKISALNQEIAITSQKLEFAEQNQMDLKTQLEEERKNHSNMIKSINSLYGNSSNYLETQLSKVLSDEIKSLNEKLDSQKIEFQKQVESLSQRNTEMEKELRLSFINCIDVFIAVQDLDIDLESTIYTLFSSANHYLQNRYSINNSENSDSDENKEDGKNLVKKLKKLQLQKDSQLKQLEELKKFFGCVYEDIDEEPDTGVFERPEGVASVQIDINDLETEKIIYTNVNNSNLSVYVYIAKSSKLGEFALKVYQASTMEHLQSVKKEVDILEFLSQYATDDNCFIKFFGKHQDNLTMFLAMDYHPKTLMNVLSEMKKAKQKFDDRYIIFYASSLLQGFAFMEGLNIFHQDIKPHNILVTNSWRLKIIDFSVSNKKDTLEAQTLQTGVLEIQGTRGYMAPELEESLSKSEKTAKFRRNKADVFSLGMTLLQMYSFEDLHTLNYRSNNWLLMEKVKLVHIPWLRTLLGRMLQVEYGSRPSFKECLQFLPGNETTHTN